MTAPTCPDGHGPMEREPGFWALSGADRQTPSSLLGDPLYVANGKGMILKVWLCPVCKLIRAYADDTED